MWCTIFRFLMEWCNGRPQLRQPQQQDPGVTVKSIESGKDEMIKYQSYDTASRILGVYIAPDGDYSQQIEILKRKADNYAIRLQSPRITPADVVTFLRTTYAPAMGYVLPCIAVDEDELHPIQAKLMTTALQKLGLSSKTPVALRHGPTDMGGLGLYDLRTEMGVAQLKLIRNAIYNNSEVGKMIIISIKYSQIEAGIKDHILEHPSIDISYLTATWITSVRQFLFLHNLSLTITDSLNIIYQGKMDQCIMQPELLQRYSNQNQRDINLVRLHLQAITISDLSTHDGISIRQEAWDGQRHQNEEQRSNWPTQPEPTNHQVKIWRRYMSDNFLRYQRKWKSKLGPIAPNTYESYQQSTQSTSPTIQFQDPRDYDTLRQYIRSLPKWYRRLLTNYDQIATNVQIWKAFRRKSHHIDIASDGGLAKQAGTFGWKIVSTFQKSEQVLFQGSGPIDGPAAVGSSTRSELGGFTAPLLLVTAITKFWGIRHKCTFRWYTDSKSAISKVRLYTTNGKATKYPEHSDYVMTIQSLAAELKRPIAACWVKGHQDENHDYEDLPREARLNVDVDELATRQYENIHKHPPMRHIEHIACQKISITINGQRYPSNWDANIRWTINGTYMKQYLTTKHNWSETTWKNIDTQMVKAYHNHKTISGKNMWFKVAHNLHSLGERKQMMSTNSAPTTNIDTCPCCHQQPETQLHMFTCDSNPNRNAALMEFSSGGSKYKEHHHFVQVMTDCIEQWLHNPQAPPLSTEVACPTLPQYNTLLPNHMMATLRAAISEQTDIGWVNLFRGYFSTKWRVLASTNMTHPDAPMSKQDGNRRSGTIIQRVQGYIQLMWKGRNDALHKCDKDDANKFLSLESAEIRHYFQQPHLLPVQDRHYCQGNILKILQSRPAFRRRWLKRVRRARAALIKDQLRQSRITSFFTRHQEHVETDNRHSTAAPCNSNTTPTQQSMSTIRQGTSRQHRLHHFFPGRPPDEAATSSTTTSKSSASS